MSATRPCSGWGWYRCRREGWACRKGRRLGPAPKLSSAPGEIGELGGVVDEDAVAHWPHRVPNRASDQSGVNRDGTGTSTSDPSHRRTSAAPSRGGSTSSNPASSSGESVSRANLALEGQAVRLLAWAGNRGFESCSSTRRVRREFVILVEARAFPRASRRVFGCRR